MQKVAFISHLHFISRNSGDENPITCDAKPSLLNHTCGGICERIFQIRIGDVRNQFIHFPFSAFLVRDSSVAGGFVISYVAKGRTFHAQVT